MINEDGATTTTNGNTKTKSGVGVLLDSAGIAKSSDAVDRIGGLEKA